MRGFFKHTTKGKPQETTWSCPHCSYLNPTSQLSCIVCDSKESKKNKNDDDNHNLNPLLISSQSTPQYLDDDDSHHTPGHFNDLDHETPGFFDDNDNIFWICSQCTYTNRDLVSKCDLCDAPRYDTLMRVGTIGRDILLDEDDDIDNKYAEFEDDDDIFGLKLEEEDIKDDIMYKQFESVLNVIVSSTPHARAAITVLKSLRKITEQVSSSNERYRVLDTQTRGVQRKLLGFDGSLEYLQLLGYCLQSDGYKLVYSSCPSLGVLSSVIILIDLLLVDCRSKLGIDCVVELSLDSGSFTLTQLVALVTHETMMDSDSVSAIRVLLLCHRCFSDSSSLICSIRKRFFVPPPSFAESYWSEDEIVVWCQTVQRPIQNKCVDILREWITDYFYVDFYLQPMVLRDLHIFNEQILGCKTESNDGWYESLSLILTSSIECAQQHIDIPNDSIANQVNELSINYGFKQKRSLFNNNRVLQNNMIYQFTAKQIAQQITLIDFQHFCRIHSREFLDKVYKNKKEKYILNLQIMIDRFNQINRYIICCILICKKLTFRVIIMQHLINVARYLLELNNFFSLMAVFSALDSIHISKLKYLWLRCDDKHKSLLKNIATVCDAKSGYNTLRKLMRRSNHQQSPTIPYIGVFLSDLTFVNDGSAKLDEGGFINFKKFKRFNERCKVVQSFQQIKYNINHQNLSNKLENDIKILNKTGDIKELVKIAVKNDEKSATNNERQIIKKNKLKIKKKKNNKKKLNKKKTI